MSRAGPPSSRLRRSAWVAWVVVGLCTGCVSPTPVPTPADSLPSPSGPAREASPQAVLPSTETPASKLPTPNLATATLPGTPQPTAGIYENADLGITFEYPRAWTARPGEDESTLTWLYSPSNVAVVMIYTPMPQDKTLEEVAAEIREAMSTSVVRVEYSDDQKVTLADGREAWRGGFTGEFDSGSPVRAIVVSTARGARLFTLLAFGLPDDLDGERSNLDALIASIHLEPPRVFGIARDQALFVLGGESNNPRAYDPATGGGDNLVFSGLVAFNPQLQIEPDLAESWQVSPDGVVYTFHLRRNAQFHDGRPVTAGDVIYSWERAADPTTDSDTVLTYLGDIVGVRDMKNAQADHISGLKAIDEHTLQVTIDAPKPYFIMKLAYSTANVVDRANIESGPEWYRTPNGTGPYKLIRWDRFKLQLYERNENYYLGSPPIRFVVSQLYAGVGLRLYETDEIDLTGAGSYDADRLRDPQEPLQADLREGVSMCTSFVTFDVTKPPFDDPKVRQAFALAVDKQQYIDVVLRGVSLQAHGVYPPALPGYDLRYQGLSFDPEQARQRLSESTYGSADNLPPIVFTASGFGSDIDSSVAALAQMWQTHLGVTIHVENLEPNVYFDELHDGNHGQLFNYGWCADYPDPENFADALFHSDAQQNLGRYSNSDLDALLESARVERDVTKRIAMYQQAERIIVEDAAGIFLTHGLSFVLVKPHIRGYVLTPIAVPIERYLSIDPARMPE